MGIKSKVRIQLIAFEMKSNFGKDCGKLKTEDLREEGLWRMMPLGCIVSMMNKVVMSSANYHIALSSHTNLTYALVVATGYLIPHWEHERHPLGWDGGEIHNCSTLQFGRSLRTGLTRIIRQLFLPKRCGWFLRKIPVLWTLKYGVHPVGWMQQILQWDIYFEGFPAPYKFQKSLSLSCTIHKWFKLTQHLFHVQQKTHKYFPLAGGNRT